MPATCARQPVTHLGDPRGALVLEQLAPMLGVFDALVLAPASLVLGDDVRAVEQAHLACRSRRA